METKEKYASRDLDVSTFELSMVFLNRTYNNIGRTSKTASRLRCSSFIVFLQYIYFYFSKKKLLKCRRYIYKFLATFSNSINFDSVEFFALFFCNFTILFFTSFISENWFSYRLNKICLFVILIAMIPIETFIGFQMLNLLYFSTCLRRHVRNCVCGFVLGVDIKTYIVKFKL